MDYKESTYEVGTVIRHNITDEIWIIGSIEDKYDRVIMCHLDDHRYACNESFDDLADFYTVDQELTSNSLFKADLEELLNEGT
jgi:hypothetical protein